MGFRSKRRSGNPTLPLELIDIIVGLLVGGIDHSNLDGLIGETASQLATPPPSPDLPNGVEDFPVRMTASKSVETRIRNANKRMKQNWTNWANCRRVNSELKRMADTHVSFGHPLMDAFKDRFPGSFEGLAHWIGLDPKEFPLVRAINKNRMESLRVILGSKGLDGSYCSHALSHCLFNVEALQVLLKDGRAKLEGFNQLKQVLDDREAGGEILKILLPHLHLKEEEWEGLLLLALYMNNVTVVETILADGRYDPSSNNNRALITSVEHGNSAIVQLLLCDKRVDPSMRQNKAIRCAALRGHEQVVILLLADRRVDPTAESNEAIFVAASFGHERVVRLLMADGRVDISDSNNRARETAMAKGYVRISKLLGSVESFNKNQNTRSCLIM
eukprot:TRINITY_DN5683_c0_g1_i1.p1 TRINITY_DN5683_c0_g1~~TRINITY_DN5683_c0_g1_i1.p1  ORF type:complete len:389 (-),score=112.72 TRINITY_DN5683_c0_g1_i1:120-1286(-)